MLLRAIAAAAALAAFPARAQPYNPFTKLSDNGLDNTADPTMGFGPSDHLTTCDGGLVFVDIDGASGNLLSSTDGGRTWSTNPLSQSSCPDTLPLVPRQTGYTLATVQNPSNPSSDRLMIVGGDDQDTDVWISDDCGATWTCLDAPEEWDPREFALLLTAPPSIGAGTIIMGAGVTMGLPSVGMFISTDGGNNWSRPVCVDPNNCNFQYTDPNFYLLPDAPTTQGMLASDRSTLYYFDDWEDGDPDLNVFYLNSSNYGFGWIPLTGADTTNMWGRKVWLGSTDPSSSAGCWFSTDYDTDDLWVFLRIDVESTNSFSTATSAMGPWTPAPISAPWPARASAAVIGTGTTAIVAGGLTFSGGAPTTPTFGDVWQVDAGVCLMNPTTGAVCSGNGQPDLAAIACNCNAGWQGDSLCSSCTPGTTYGPSCTLCPTDGDGTPCNADGGGGYCDSQQGCVCSTGWGGAACDTCLPNFAGATCAPCAPCTAGGGTCDGNGTTGGTGKCVCNPGWTGSTCSIPPPTPSPTPPPTPPSPSADGLSAGGAAGVAVTVLGVVGAGAVMWLGGPVATLALASAAAGKVAAIAGAKVGGGAAYASLSSSSSSMSSSSSSSGAKLSPGKLSSDQAARRLLGASGGGGASTPLSGGGGGGGGYGAV